MTDKQQKFIAAYQQTRNEKQAALAAGYRPRDAARMARRTRFAFSGPAPRRPGETLGNGQQPPTV